MEKAQIRIIRSKRKTVALEIRPDLSVLVRAPYWMADWQIRKFVDEKSDWLYAHLREMEQKQKLEAARPKAAPLTPGELQVLADEALRVIRNGYGFMPRLSA
ncbi:MAG: YgjP-like metallopeptidase domain-containing protein [Roseburia faecis]